MTDLTLPPALGVETLDIDDGRRPGTVTAGTLYGVGVGPGDPELMTLKAYRLITNATTIAYFCKEGRTGHGRTIINDYIPQGCRQIRMAYPVTTEIPVSDPRYGDLISGFYDTHADKIAAALDLGGDVVVVSEGDSFFYGSFMPIFHRLSARFKTEVVPGVPAMVASWTKAGLPIAYGDDALIVIPGTLPAGELASKLQAADAVVIMKLGRHLDKVRAALREAGRADDAVYIERCSMAGERILPLEQADARRAPYFSLILVPGKGRCL